MSGTPASDARLIEVLGLVAERLMTAETARLCGAELGTRSAERTNRRNGFRRQVWKSGLGEIALKVPRLRKGRYHPTFLANGAIHRDDVRTVLYGPHGAAGSAEAVARLLRAMGTGDLSEDAVGTLSAEIAVCLGKRTDQRQVDPHHARAQAFSPLARSGEPDCLEEEDLVGDLDDEKEERAVIAALRQDAYKPVTEYATSANHSGIDQYQGTRLHDAYETD
jgi:hypothetical protein